VPSIFPCDFRGVSARALSCVARHAGRGALPVRYSVPAHHARSRERPEQVRRLLGKRARCLSPRPVPALGAWAACVSFSTQPSLLASPLFHFAVRSPLCAEFALTYVLKPAPPFTSVLGEAEEQLPVICHRSWTRTPTDHLLCRNLFSRGSGVWGWRMNKTERPTQLPLVEAGWWKLAMALGRAAPWPTTAPPPTGTIFTPAPADDLPDFARLPQDHLSRRAGFCWPAVRVCGRGMGLSDKRPHFTTLQKYSAGPQPGAGHRTKSWWPKIGRAGRRRKTPDHSRPRWDATGLA